MKSGHLSLMPLVFGALVKTTMFGVAVGVGLGIYVHIIRLSSLAHSMDGVMGLTKSLIIQAQFMVVATTAIQILHIRTNLPKN